MGFVEGLLLGVIIIFGVILYILNEKIRYLSDSLVTVVKETEQHFKEVHFAFISIATSIETMTDHVSNVATHLSPSPTVKENISKIKGSTEKFMKLREITDEQFSLFGTTQSPSSSASHSKHKNDVLRKLKALEEEKRSIMQSLLDDGIDPEITVLDETGSHKTMKMSEAMKLPITAEKSTDSKTPRKKDGNIIRLFDKGDKDDEDNSGDPTVH